MQLSKLERTQKIGNNKFICIEKKTNKEYILTSIALFEFNTNLCHIDHQNLINIIDNWEENGLMWIIQNNYKLKPLKKGIFQETQILRIVYSISDAMNKASKENIFGTVTLQNVFLDDSNKVKIDLLSLNVIPLQYASPEVLQKRATYSDVWSLGVIIYFLTNNRMPFQGDNDKTLAYNIIFKDPSPFDFNQYPVIHQLLKKIFIKNIQKRFSFQQIVEYLNDKINIDIPSSLYMNQEVSKQQQSKQETILSLKESKIEQINQSQSSEKYDSSQFIEIKPIIPQIITLDAFEDIHSVHRQLKNRPQSSTQNYVKNDQKELFQRIQRIRPNSAIGQSGKEFISKTIKQELNNRRHLVQPMEIENITSTRNHNMKKQQFKEVSVDLNEAKQLKNEHVIRVYNLEYQTEKESLTKRSSKPFLKQLPSKSTTPKNLNKREQDYFDEIKEWKYKIQANMKNQLQSQKK